MHYHGLRRQTCFIPALVASPSFSLELVHLTLLAKGTTGFGTESVSGRRRVPKPPTKMSACIGNEATSHANEDASISRTPLPSSLLW